jgi:hypothetical protein
VDIDLQRLDRRPRGLFSPEFVDEPLTREDLVRVQEQGGEQSALLGRPEGDRAIIVFGLDRPE